MKAKEQAFLKILGERIRGFRTGKDMTQAKLAEEVGLHMVSMSSIERGIANPSIITLRNIARALGVTLTELLSISEEGITNQKIPWEGEVEFTELLMKYRTLGEKEKGILLETVRAMVGRME